MSIVSAITYSAITVFAATLSAVYLVKLIFPAVTLIIGLHFIPLGKIMNRKIDYFIAPVLRFFYASCVRHNTEFRQPTVRPLDWIVI